MSTSLLRVVLTGFMGAGKSTVGALLAAELGWRFVDVDEELVRAEGYSVTQLFDRSGEAHFRRLEEEFIFSLLSLEEAVIALGGGALESQTTRSRLLNLPATQIVYLETPFDVALVRCVEQVGSATRPVLRDKAALADRFRRRQEHYRQAHLSVATADRTPSEIVAILMSQITVTGK